MRDGQFVGGITVALGAVVTIVAMLTGSSTLAQETGGCLVEEAAQAALERELALIEELAIDVEVTFNGGEDGMGGCIADSLFDEFDLSNLIPSPDDLFASLSDGFIEQAIAAARDQVCERIEDAIGGAIGDAQGRMADFSSGLSDELAGVLDNGWGDLGL